jgi:hypothetical protein
VPHPKSNTTLVFSPRAKPGTSCPYEKNLVDLIRMIHHLLHVMSQEKERKKERKKKLIIHDHPGSQNTYCSMHGKDQREGGGFKVTGV